MILNFFFSFLYSCQGLSVHENVGNAHPFGHPTEKRHNILLHIEGPQCDKRDPSVGRQNICFLILSIEVVDRQINDNETNHTTKKFLYDSQKKLLSILGYKYQNTDPTLNQTLKNRTDKTISQIITPRTIYLKGQEPGDAKFIGDIQMEKTLETNATEYFYTTLRERYKEKIIRINLRRFRADGSKTTYDNPELDNFPYSTDIMHAYLDLSKSCQSPQPTPIPNSKNNSSHTNPKSSSLFTTNSILAISFVSLGAILLYHFFWNKSTL